MGCFFSSAAKHPALAAKGGGKGKPKQMGSSPPSSVGDAGGGIIIMGSSAAFKKKLDPKDFQCLNLIGQTVVKRPGSINGQQFIVMDCEDCDIWVCDHCEMVTIDRSRNCRIFIGPCESSIFVRNCSNVKLIAACRQFRTRDCEDLDVLMHCASQPSIETSKRVRFGCFQFFYFALGAQFEKARLPVFNNRWSEVYNFNPKHGGYELLMGAEAEPSAFLKPLHEHTDFVTADESDCWRTQSPVPRTDGPVASGADNAVVVCAPEAGIDGALDLIRALTVQRLHAMRATYPARRSTPRNPARHACGARRSRSAPPADARFARALSRDVAEPMQGAGGLRLARTIQFELDTNWRQRLYSALAFAPGSAELNDARNGASVIVLQVTGAGSAASAAAQLGVFNAARGKTLAWASTEARGGEEMAAFLFVNEDTGNSMGPSPGPAHH
jgi:hypothetical protein